MTKETLTLLINIGIGGFFALLVYFLKRLIDQYDKFRETTEKDIGDIRRKHSSLRCDHEAFKARVETHLDIEE